MSTNEMEEKLNIIMDQIYKLAIALVSISDFEGCEYGFEEEINAARKYINDYEQDHKGD